MNQAPPAEMSPSRKLPIADAVRDQSAIFRKTELVVAEINITSDNAPIVLVEMAVADSYIVVFEAKYSYNFWRPITAIRNGDIDGNDASPSLVRLHVSLLGNYWLGC